MCRYSFGRNDCGELVHRDMVVLENEIVRGYRSAVIDHRLCLDFDHLVVAIRALAKFHSLSYRAKHVDGEKFTDLVAVIKDTQWDEEGQGVVKGTGLEGLLSVALDKIIECRGKGGGRNTRVQDFRTELLADALNTLKLVM